MADIFMSCAQNYLLIDSKMVPLSSISNYWDGFFFLPAATNRLTILSSLKGKLNAINYIYDERDGLAPGSFPFLHKPSGTPSKPWVLSLVPSHHPFPFLIASGDFHILFSLLLLTDSSCALQISPHDRMVIFAWWTSDSGVWWFGQTYCEIKLIFL